MIDLKLIHEYAEMQRQLDEARGLPSFVAHPPPPPRRELFTPEFLAAIMALRIVTGRLLSLSAAGQNDPAAWLRSERDLMDRAISPSTTDDQAMQLLALTRQQIDVLFSEAKAALQNSASDASVPSTH